MVEPQTSGSISGPTALGSNIPKPVVLPGTPVTRFEKWVEIAGTLLLAFATVGYQPRLSFCQTLEN
jgi:hypothetical protein